MEAYPNPFNPSTKLLYYLPEDAYTKVKIYDILANEVKILLNGYIIKGWHETYFVGTELSSGTYFYTIQRGNNIKVNKLILIK